MSIERSSSKLGRRQFTQSVLKFPGLDKLQAKIIWYCVSADGIKSKPALCVVKQYSFTLLWVHPLYWQQGNWPFLHDNAPFNSTTLRRISLFCVMLCRRIPRRVQNFLPFKGVNVFHLFPRFLSWNFMQTEVHFTVFRTFKLLRPIDAHYKVGLPEVFWYYCRILIKSILS